MEIIKIGNDAMKISLCNSEAYECGFTDNQSKEELKKNFVNLLLKAKGVVDFRVASEKLIGEMFSAADGGCEIFVSRVEVDDKLYKEKLTQEFPKKTRQVGCVLCFDNIKDVISVAIRLSGLCVVGGALYYDEEKEKYYIILDDVSIKDIKYAFLSEYSTIVKTNMVSYIKEHYRCICKRNAVEKLSKC